VGTSQSKPPAHGGAPLVPSWADQDPLPPVPDPSPPAQGSPTPVQPLEGGALQPRRNSGMRRALKKFYQDGDHQNARRALGHFARRSMGSGAIAPQRLARAARVGAAAFSAIAGAAAGAVPAAGTLNFNSLAGRPITEAIAAIVDAFSTPGILDEDAIRTAMSEALAEAFSGLDTFDPSNIDDYTALVAARTFVAEMVFASVMSEQGQAAANVTPQQAVARENDIRDIVRELTDVQATPILQNAGPAMTPVQMEALIGDIAGVVYREIARW
jgi:hypothetical protein